MSQKFFVSQKISSCHKNFSCLSHKICFVLISLLVGHTKFILRSPGVAGMSGVHPLPPWRTLCEGSASAGRFRPAIFNYPTKTSPYSITGACDKKYTYRFAPLYLRILLPVVENFISIGNSPLKVLNHKDNIKIERMTICRIQFQKWMWFFNPQPPWFDTKVALRKKKLIFLSSHFDYVQLW